MKSRKNWKTVIYLCRYHNIILARKSSPYLQFFEIKINLNSISLWYYLCRLVLDVSTLLAMISFSWIPITLNWAFGTTVFQASAIVRKSFWTKNETNMYLDYLGESWIHQKQSNQNIPMGFIINTYLFIFCVERW